MHVVLPEVDGRIFGGVLSFKEAGERDPDLQCARVIHRAHEGRVAAFCDRVAGVAAAGLRPGGGAGAWPWCCRPTRGAIGQMAHAVGLDAVASARAMLEDLRAAGHAVETGLDEAALAAARLVWPWADYAAALESLPEALRADLQTAWGAPEADPAATPEGIALPVLRMGHALVALQPERGEAATRDDDYHDLSRVPRHGYVAFYLWLQRHADALVHIGAHGTLEWLPGKAVALSETCWPEVLTGAPAGAVPLHRQRSR